MQQFNQNAQNNYPLESTLRSRLIQGIVDLIGAIIAFVNIKTLFIFF